jgi:hypothetical protein
MTRGKYGARCSDAVPSKFLSVSQFEGLSLEEKSAHLSEAMADRERARRPDAVPG